MTAKSTTQRSLDYLAEAGWLAQVVERRIPYAKTTVDLFGFIDILALRDAETLAVQTTTADHAANRIRKISEHPNLAAVRAAGWTIHVHGWRKSMPSGRWVCNLTDVS